MNYSVREEVALPNGCRALLYDMPITGAHVVENLVCETPNGSLLWTASPGELGPDEFVAVHFDGTMLVANTWSGFALWLDPMSGQEVRRAFIK
jgi:hypothetical protein